MVQDCKLGHCKVIRLVQQQWKPLMFNSCSCVYSSASLCRYSYGCVYGSAGLYCYSLVVCMPVWWQEWTRRTPEGLRQVNTEIPPWPLAEALEPKTVPVLRLSCCLLSEEGCEVRCQMLRGGGGNHGLGVWLACFWYRRDLIVLNKFLGPALLLETFSWRYSHSARSIKVLKWSECRFKYFISVGCLESVFVGILRFFVIFLKMFGTFGPGR